MRTALIAAAMLGAACSGRSTLGKIADQANPVLATLELKVGALRALLRAHASAADIYEVCGSADPELKVLERIDANEMGVDQDLANAAHDLLDHERQCIDQTQGMRLRTTCVEYCQMLWGGLTSETNRLAALARKEGTNILGLPEIGK